MEEKKVVKKEEVGAEAKKTRSKNYPKFKILDIAKIRVNNPVKKKKFFNFGKSKAPAATEFVKNQIDIRVFIDPKEEAKLWGSLDLNKLVKLVPYVKKEQIKILKDSQIIEPGKN